jgi:hypothetical protein
LEGGAGGLRRNRERENLLVRKPNRQVGGGLVFWREIVHPFSILERLLDRHVSLAQPLHETADVTLRDVKASADFVLAEAMSAL